MTELVIDRSGDRLGLTLNRPDQSNALSPALVEAMLAALADADGVRFCTIRGEGRNFCAGFDLSDLSDLSDGDLLWRFVRIELMLQAVHHAPFPIVAFAHRHVVGAGADLFAACTNRVAAGDARFRMPGWNFELALGTLRLARRVGTDRARDMLIDARTVEAEEALAIGLAGELAEADQWPAIEQRLAERATSMPPYATAEMLALTGDDTRALDLAAVAATAGRPGLKQRIEAFRAG
ncbi:MAG: enoyl-CoA hydratase/isomerase family protein [Acidimicrobiales bacterium]